MQNYYMDSHFSQWCKIILIACAVTLAMNSGTAQSHAGVIRGTVRFNGSPVTHPLNVELIERNPDTLISGVSDATTTSNGVYQFTGLPDRSYYVQVLDDTNGEYAAEIYQNAYKLESATAVTISNGLSDVDPVDIDVELGGLISGFIKDDQGQPLDGITVGIAEMIGEADMELTDGGFHVVSDGTGKFCLGVRPGVYTLVFWDSSENPHWATQLFSNTVAHEWATPVVVTNVGHKITNADATMRPGYVISGMITDPNGEPLSGGWASFSVYDPERNDWGSTVSKDLSSGLYSVNFPPGTYRVVFAESTMLYEREYWSGSPDASGATPIVISNSDARGIDAQLEYSPLARWAFEYRLDPFSNVDGWLAENPDGDCYDNFHEFAFGTNPTNGSSAYQTVISNQTNFSVVLHQNTSTAYWLEYELQRTTNLSNGIWTTIDTLVPTSVPASHPLSYQTIVTNSSTTTAPQLFIRIRATINLE